MTTSVEFVCELPDEAVWQIATYGCFVIAVSPDHPLRIIYPDGTWEEISYQLKEVK